MLMENETRVLKIDPEDVGVIGLFDFQVAYRKHVLYWGEDRTGMPPEFTFTVRPGYEIKVSGYQP